MIKHTNRTGKVIINVISSSLAAFLVVGLSGCSNNSKNCQFKNLKGECADSSSSSYSGSSGFFAPVYGSSHSVTHGG